MAPNVHLGFIMSVFTVFAFGTLESKSTINIISQFSQACVSPHIILEGPDVFGFDVNTIVDNALEKLIEWLSNQESIENKINFAGFSRGSISCVHLSNRLKKIEKGLQKQVDTLNDQDRKLLNQLKAIKLQIFGLDPVAGMTSKGNKLGRVIPDNVTAYVPIYQLDEMRRDFKPQDLTRTIITSPKKTKFTPLIMYGNHTDSTKIKSPDLESGPTITWYLLHQFLTQHGTQFKEDKLPLIVYDKGHRPPKEIPENPSAKDLLRLFNEHHLKRDHYLQAARVLTFQDSMPMPRSIRTLNNHKKYYVKNSDFFVNQLERELFKITYPQVFNYLFERNQFDPRFPNASASQKLDVIAELSIIKMDNEGLFERLKSRGVTHSEQGIDLGDPRGYYYLEPCASLSQILPHMVPPFVKEMGAQFDKLMNLEQEVYRLCFRYEREKPEFFFHRHRAQTERVKSIRNEINNLVNNANIDRDTKYHMILDKIEEQFKTLMLGNSSTSLIKMLYKLLTQHGRQYKIHFASLPRTIVAGFIDIALTFINELINFIGHLGYIGGAFLFGFGTLIQDLGKRINDVIGPLGYNPLKYFASAIAYTLQIIGFVIKNSFGLKPLTEAIDSGIKYIKDAIVTFIQNESIERTDVTESSQEQPVRDATNPVRFHAPRVRPRDRFEHEESLVMLGMN